MEIIKSPKKRLFPPSEFADTNYCNTRSPDSDISFPDTPYVDFLHSSQILA